MTEVRVCGSGNDLTVDGAKLLYPVTESHDLSGTHKREVQGVEEDDHILPWRVHKGKWGISYTQKLKNWTYQRSWEYM